MWTIAGYDKDSDPLIIVEESECEPRVNRKDPEMNTEDGQSLLAPIIVELTAGMFFNLFIVSVIFYDFYKQKTMSTSNKILVSLGISNIGYNILISAGFLDQFIGLRVSSTYDLSSMYIILLLYSVSSCAWLTASLGAFYFIKISQTTCLSWVKFHIRSIVPWMILALQIMAFINSFLSFLLISPQNYFRNTTGSPPPVLQALAENKSGLMNASQIVTAIPCVIAVIFTGCIIWTLKRHSSKMERSVETVDNGSLTSYLRVVRRMTYFLLFYGIFYVLMLIFCFSIVPHVQSGFWVTLLLLSAFTPVQSVLLILGNPRLQDAWKEMLPCHSFTRFLHGSKEG